MNKEERERLGFVGKKEEINPFTGKKHVVDYDSEDEIGCTASVFSMKEWLAISNRSGNGKLKAKLYSETEEESNQGTTQNDIIEEE